MKILITGVSSGVGFEAVLELIQSNDHEVVALARSEDKLKKLYDIAITHADNTLKHHFRKDYSSFHR